MFRNINLDDQPLDRNSAASFPSSSSFAFLLVFSHIYCLRERGTDYGSDTLLLVLFL